MNTGTVKYFLNIKKTTIIISAGFVFLLFLSLYQLLYSQGKGVFGSLKGKMQVLNQIITYINEFHFEKVDMAKLMDGAFDGIMKQLDPHSVYIPPRELEDIPEVCLLENLLKH